MIKDLGKVVTIISVSLLTPMAAFNFLLMKFLSLPLWKLLLFDFLYLAFVIVPVYAGITKGDKAYAQPSKKYLLKYIWFPLCIGAVVFAFSILNVPMVIQGTLFVSALLGVNIYFYFK